MNLLHTSDWHLGRTLYGKKRDDEFTAFLDWLLQTIEKEAIDVLIVAGDVFDTSAPSHFAQKLYYQFLCQVAASSCRHVVVIAGNHDSPSFINAPQDLLAALNVHVIGQACENLADEVLLLKDDQGVAELLVCAVPYLRDRDIRTVEAGESTTDKAQKLIAGIQQHYVDVAGIALQIQSELDKPVPIVATGHLFAAGGTTLADDGVRDLYVGNLAHISAAMFPDCFNYVALGHLHVPQRVAQSETIRYSGSPIAMGFGEAKQQKSVSKVSFNAGLNPTVELIHIPTFQALQSIQGNWAQIQEKIQAATALNKSCWLEITYLGDELMPDLREQIEALVQGSELEVLRIKNQRIIQRTLQQNTAQEKLDELSELEVFTRCMLAHEVPEAQQLDLLQAYQEILQTVHENSSS